jgi:hypothetical protein
VLFSVVILLFHSKCFVFFSEALFPLSLLPLLIVLSGVFFLFHQRCFVFSQVHFPDTTGVAYYSVRFFSLFKNKGFTLFPRVFFPLSPPVFRVVLSRNIPFATTGFSRCTL